MFYGLILSTTFQSLAETLAAFANIFSLSIPTTTWLSIRTDQLIITLSTAFELIPQTKWLAAFSFTSGVGF